jgi:hypothetical protein
MPGYGIGRIGPFGDVEFTVAIEPLYCFSGGNRRRIVELEWRIAALGD